MNAKDREALIALGLATELRMMSDGYHSTIVFSNEQAADRLLDSDWFRLQLADACDQGIALAGRYGHEDSWDNEINPHIDNPWRTREELAADGWDVDEDGL